MKKYFSCLLLMSWTTLLFSSCEKEEDVKTSEVKLEKSLQDTRQAIVHLYKDTVYVLHGPFIRNAGETLIIDAGTVIKVSADDFNDRGSILINAGGIIEANGTATAPIVFTSNTYAGTQKLNWNGIKIIGKAVNNTRGTTGNVADNSGVLKYVRIEFASLSLDAVGSETTIDNIMVSYVNTKDQTDIESSFSIYGGSFNAKHLISYACGGPADFYITDGYNGKLQNILAFRHPFFGATGTYPINALAGVFIEDNSQFTYDAQPYTFPTISNLTIIGPDGQNGSVAQYFNSNIRSAAIVAGGNASLRLRNSLLLGFPEGGLFADDSLSAKNIQYGPSEITHSVFQSNDSTRTIYLPAAAYPPYTSEDFKNIILNPVLNNQVLHSSADFMMEDPFTYNKPVLILKDMAPFLTDADFSGANYNDAFFDKVNYRGAFGKENWLQGWTNFTPLKTNYNFPQ